MVLFSVLQIITHFTVLVTMGRIFQLPFKEIVLSSNANIGGPSTAAAMAASKRWNNLIRPAMMSGIVGYGVATIIGLYVNSVLSCITSRI